MFKHPCLSRWWQTEWHFSNLAGHIDNDALGSCPSQVLQKGRENPETVRSLPLPKAVGLSFPPALRDLGMPVPAVCRTPLCFKVLCHYTWVLLAEWLQLLVRLVSGDESIGVFCPQSIWQLNHPMTLHLSLAMERQFRLIRGCLCLSYSTQSAVSPVLHLWQDCPARLLCSSELRSQLSSGCWLQTGLSEEAQLPLTCLHNYGWV
jgi:hypothetical protein